MTVDVAQIAALTPLLLISGAGCLALLLATAVGVPVGVFAAARHNRIGDRLSMAAVLILYSVPSFVLIPLLLAVDI